MPVVISYSVLGCMGLYGLLLIADVIRTRRAKRFLLEGAILLAVFVTLRLTTGFPTPSGRQAFGGFAPLPVIGLMFLAILLGMVASYVFYFRGTFSWLSFVKPLCVSPIVLLPLLGTLQGVSTVEPIQLISFCFLAFQNGFFWKVVFERAKAQA